MQTNKIIIQLLFATLILLTASACPMEQKLTQSIVFELGGEVGSDSSGVVISDLSKIDETIDILKKRLDSYGLNNSIERNTSTNDYTLMLPEKANLEAVKRLISTVGKIEIWETWQPGMGDMPTADDSISRYIRIHPYDNIMLVHKSDTAKARRMLIDYGVEKQWPGNVRSVWSNVSEDPQGTVYRLYMLRAKHSPQAPAITNSHIETTTVEEGINDRWLVSATLNTAGSGRFERVTAENVGQALAIALDGKVYSAPIVTSKIEGGKLQISGNFTQEEAEEFAAALRYNPLPLSVHIK
jgi:preprotein translocase subunit SecD